MDHDEGKVDAEGRAQLGLLPAPSTLTREALLLSVIYYESSNILFGKYILF